MGKRRKPKQQGRSAVSPAIRGEIEQTFATAIELHKAGNLQQAETLYKAVLSLDPQHADSLHMLGVMAHQVGEYAAAVDILGAAIAADGGKAHYHFNRGVSLQALDRQAEAVAAYRDATRLAPEYRAAWENLGVALQDAGDADGAMDAYRRAKQIDPDSKIARLNLGTLLANSGRAADAQAEFAALIALTPAYGEAHLKYASTRLVLGDLAEGWRHYAWRWHAGSFVDFNPVRVLPFPTWDGSSLDGRTLMINAEQGIGDEIMFASCYADAIDAAGHCVIECDPRLEPVMARSFPGTTILPRATLDDFGWSDELPDVDVRVDAGSLPAVFRPTLDSFPDRAAFLTVDPAARAGWEHRLAASGPGLRVGISWRGGKEQRGQRARSLPLAQWQPIFAATDARFVDLQYGEHRAEVDAFCREGAGELTVFDDVDPLRNIDDFLALIAALDLVISIDNSTVFMADSVGTPVWALLPVSGEWRWLAGRSSTPWCPHAELFRKSPGDDWDTVVADVAGRLATHA
jgi:tetratricopeptide (TPR) repeat protein